MKTKNDFRCALAVHGAFDVPLIQYVYVFEEKVLHEAIIFAYITYCQRKTHPLARPLGWEDDCTERTFAKSGNAIEQVLHTEVVEGSVLVSREFKASTGALTSSMCIVDCRRLRAEDVSVSRKGRV